MSTPTAVIDLSLSRSTSHAMPSHAIPVTSGTHQNCAPWRMTARTSVSMAGSYLFG